MKFKTSKLGSLFRSRESLEREAELSTSLDSSLDFFGRFTGCSSCCSSDDRARPIAMKFHPQWRHPECDVMKWYQKQQRSSTRFSSIEHHKGIKGPFYHEFLLTHLTDGSICRLERMGEGSRADAIRWVGCASHDIIQWFSADDYTKSELSRQPSESLLRVSLPREFDLLDVLAICYTVQRHQRAASYTLQRFNCYFLCYTVLAILARRVAHWQPALAQGEWKSMVDKTLDDMACIGQDEAEKFLAFGIFSLLFPESNNPAEFLLSSLRSQLEYTHAGQEIARCLWVQDLCEAVHWGLTAPLERAVEETLSESNPDSGELHDLTCRVDEKRFPRDGLDFPSIQESMSRAFLQGVSEICYYAAQIGEQTLQMILVEHPYSTCSRLMARALGGTDSVDLVPYENIS